MIDYTVVCDNCSVQIDSNRTSPKLARQVALAEGTLIRYKRKDYCVSCAKLIFSGDKCASTLHPRPKDGLLDRWYSGDETMPMNRQLYPDNWEQIALEVKELADWTCRECQRPCRMRNESIPDFVERIWGDEQVVYGDWWEGRGGAMKNDLYELVEAAPQRFTLTVAHLDHDPANCTPENLRALCSVCHLRYDAAHHAANAAATRRRQAEEAGQLSFMEE